MGQKINPISTRIWQFASRSNAAWYSDHHYTSLVIQQIALQKYLLAVLNMANADVGRVYLEFYPDGTRSVIAYRLRQPDTRQRFVVACPKAYVDGLLSEKLGSFFEQIQSDRVACPKHSVSKALRSKAKTNVSSVQLENATSNQKSSTLSSSVAFNLCKGEMQTTGSVEALRVFGRVSRHITRLLHQGQNNFGMWSAFRKVFTTIHPQSSTGYDRVILILLEVLEELDAKRLSTGIDWRIPEKQQTFGMLTSSNLQTALQRQRHLLVKGSFLKPQKKKHLQALEAHCAQYRLFGGQQQGFLSMVWLNMRLPFSSAEFLAAKITQSLENRDSFRKISRQIIERIQKSPDILGVRLMLSGRMQGAEMARVETRKYGQTSTHTLTSRIDYANRVAYTNWGLFGIQVWLCFRSPTQV